MDGLIKIGDFGLVTNIIEGDSEQENNSKSSNGKHTNRVGTQLYMSPEQVFLLIRFSIEISKFQYYRLEITNMIIKWIYFRWGSYFMSF